MQDVREGGNDHDWRICIPFRRIVSMSFVVDSYV